MPPSCALIRFPLVSRQATCSVTAPLVNSVYVCAATRSMPPITHRASTSQYKEVFCRKRNITVARLLYSAARALLQISIPPLRDVKGRNLLGLCPATTLSSIPDVSPQSSLSSPLTPQAAQTKPHPR